jgi:hypothetical protein
MNCSKFNDDKLNYVGYMVQTIYAFAKGHYMPTTKLKVWDKPNRYGVLCRRSINKGKKMVASMSRDRICM